MDQLISLRDVLFANPRIVPERRAILCDSRWMTFGELRSRVLAVASALHREGIRPGDRVALLMENCPEFIVCFFAITGMGAIVVPLNWRLHPSEHVTLLQDAQAKVMVASSTFLTSIERVKSQVSSVIRVVLVEGESCNRDSFSQWATPAQTMPEAVALSSATVAAIVYTSGTTSRPKGVVLTHGNYLADIHNVASVSRANSNSTNLQLSPLYHAACIHSLMHLAVGGSTILNRRYDVGETLGLIERERVTYFFSVPTALYQMMDHPDFKRVNRSSLRTLSYGAASVTTSRLQEAMASFGPILIHAYGLTETTSHASVLTAEDHAIAFGSIGRGVGLSALKVVNEAGHPCTPGEVGEIRVSGPNVTTGYWERPVETNELFQDGWLKTGDLARTDERGFVYVVDRKKDLVISGGVNIYSREIEDVVAGHPDVAEVAIVGIPDPHWGEAVVAVVVLRPGATADAAAILEHCRHRVGGFKVPKRVEFIAELPKNPSGKVLKTELRRLLSTSIRNEGRE